MAFRSSKKPERHFICPDEQNLVLLFKVRAQTFGSEGGAGIPFPRPPFLPAPPERFGILRNAAGVSLKMDSRIFKDRAPVRKSLAISELVQYIKDSLNTFRRLRRRENPPAKVRKGGGAAPIKTAKEPGEKHRREPYFNFGGRKFFNKDKACV